MRQKGDLRIIGRPGEVPALGSPIPEFAYVTIPVFAMARIQEWLVFTDDDAGTFDLCGQRFRVLSWADAEKALLVTHTGPTPS